MIVVETVALTLVAAILALFGVVLYKKEKALDARDRRLRFGEREVRKAHEVALAKIGAAKALVDAIIPDEREWPARCLREGLDYIERVVDLPSPVYVEQQDSIPTFEERRGYERIPILRGLVDVARSELRPEFLRLVAKISYDGGDVATAYAIDSRIVLALKETEFVHGIALEMCERLVRKWAESVAAKT